MKILTINIANYDDHPGWVKRKHEIIKLLT